MSTALNHKHIGPQQIKSDSRCAIDLRCDRSTSAESDGLALDIGEWVDQYRILSFLGSGGMGQVFRAEDTLTGVHVAIKLLPNGVCADPDLRDRLQTEAVIASTIRHPNVVHTFDPGEHRNCLYLVMELVEGPTLAEVIGQGAVDTGRAFDIALQLSRGLNAIHRAQIIHRDIKPANILIDRNGTAKFADLGLAVSWDPRSGLGSPSTAGTLAYTAPEHITGDPIDCRSDLFSLGVVYYQLFTGRLPFYSEYAQVIPYAILNDDPQPLSDHRSGLPEGLQPIIDKLLAKNPSDRYTSARQVTADLEQLLVAAVS